MPRDEGLPVSVHVSPRAKTERLGTVDTGPDGRLAVTAQVTAPPADGSANEALLRLLARSWQLPRRDLAIVAGAASRNKIVRVAGDPQELRGRIAAVEVRSRGR
jgi:uncharacterized protein